MKRLISTCRRWIRRGRVAWIRFRSPTPSALVARTRTGSTADLEMLLSEIAALNCRILRHSPRRRPELTAVLQGAVNAGSLDVAAGRQLYDKAVQRFQQVTQTHNQIIYMAGAFCGMLLGIFAAGWLIGIAQATFVWATHLSDAPTIASLCSFGLIGSLTSIFMRLPKLQLQQDDSPVLVALNGLIQPFIALGFVAVVFVILKYKVLGISFAATEPDAPLWVAAFLCGFSERFAPGILDSAVGAFAHK